MGHWGMCICDRRIMSFDGDLNLGCKSWWDSSSVIYFLIYFSWRSVDQIVAVHVTTSLLYLPCWQRWNVLYIQPMGPQRVAVGRRHTVLGRCNTLKGIPKTNHCFCVWQYVSCSHGVLALFICFSACNMWLACTDTISICTGVFQYDIFSF